MMTRGKSGGRQKSGGETSTWRFGKTRALPVWEGIESRKGSALPRARVEHRRGLALAAQKFENNIQYVSDIPCVGSGASGGSGRHRIRLWARKACARARGQRHLPAFGGAFQHYVQPDSIRPELRNDSRDERRMSERCVLFRRLILQVWDCELRVRSSGAATSSACSVHPTESLLEIECHQLEDWDRGEVGKGPDERSS